MNRFDHVAKQRRLRQILCCPHCRGDLLELDTAELGGFMLSARLLCATCGTVGHVCNGRFFFGARPFVRWGSPFVSEKHLSIRQLTLAQIGDKARGKWQETAEFVWTGNPGALEFGTNAIGVNIDLLSHSWAGIVEILIGENLAGKYDLFEPNGSSRVSIPLFLGHGQHRVEVRVSGGKNPNSPASQCHVLGVQELHQADTAQTLEAVLTGNRGNPYPSVWPEMVTEAADDAIILDCGSGDRCFPDDRVMNFEYCSFGLPDLYGDGHSIPMKDNSFDLILSQAVFEHLYDPKKAASEIERILKPGGVVYVESAFMQPLHAVPFHFFNTTPWGLEKLFEDLDREEVRSHGTLGQTLNWIYGLCDLESRSAKEKVEALLSLATELDALITPEEMRKFASFVSLVARKKTGA